MIIAALRSVWRIYRGLRPHPSDLDRIITGLRNRQRRKRSTVSTGWLNLLARSNPIKQSQRLQRFQLRKLKNTVKYIYQYVPYYREQLDTLGVKPGDIKSLEDIRKLPITHRSVLQERRDDFISREPGLSPVLEFKTSGTTGERLMIYLSENEFHYYAAAEAISGLISGTLRPTTIYQINLSLDESAASVISTRAAQMAGALVLNYGLTGTVEDHVKSIFLERNIPGKDKKVSVLFSAPPYLWTLTRKVEEMGWDFKQSGLKRILTGGAMVTETLKKHIKETWGIPLSEGYAMVEAPAIVAGECSEGHMHFLDLTGYIEVLDPETCEPVPYGEEGVLVITEFYPEKETMPFLRYWTKDVVISGSGKICPCGIPTTYILDIVGRVDQRITLGGYKYYPQEIGDSLLGIPGLISPPRFKITTAEGEDGQFVYLDVERIDTLSGMEQEELEKDIYQKIAFVDNPFWKIGVVKVKVNIVPPNTIADPFKYKHLGPDLT